MTDDSDGRAPMWPPATFTKQMQEMGEETAERQMELFQQFMSGGDGGFGGLSQLDAMSRGSAVFKTRVQSGGRISIPDAEREALDIQEGDIVQTVIIPIKRSDQ